ncbi:hypothetical protein [Idiomarina seosinensis]|uniref:GGDEF domain-containing protein n=1 Tax=Idiomarina seosinensis TaxID=281739 RepID=A0A432ZD84_9GAMM|nr:hypothetical protein [Idiomarina seosinensis]RUO75332.1 hypothetical protein CWI81_10185 [Idiomarina seosinensis]
MSKNLVAVITGDIVDSSQIEVKAYNTVLEHLTKVLKQLAKSREMHFDVFRGDEFQIILTFPKEALFVASIIRLSLKSAKIDVRQSIAVAEIDKMRDDVKSSTGEAFVMSGRNLDKMKSELFIFSSSDSSLHRHLGVTVKILDAHLSSLTKTEAEVLSCFLQHDNESHANLGNRLKKSRANTTKLLNASHYTAVLEYLTYAGDLISEAKA